MTPKRIQLRRTKGWRKPEGAIVVARPSKWGNPYRVDERSPIAQLMPDGSYHEYTRAGVVAMYRWSIEHQPAVIDQARAELRGHDLCCWCPLDQPCHADVLLEVANR